MSRSGFGRGRDGERNNRQNGPSSTSTSSSTHSSTTSASSIFSIFIQSEDCGKLIGKAGTKLRELQDESQTQIKVSRDSESDGTRKVDIMGGPDEIKIARQLIDNILNISGRPGNQSNQKQGSNNRENFYQNSSSTQVCNDDENWNSELNENLSSSSARNQDSRHENFSAVHNDPWNDRWNQPVANNGDHSTTADNGGWEENDEWNQAVTATFTRSAGTRNRACHNCGQEGHMVRDCPQSGGGGGGGRGSSRSGTCYKCGQEGHQARDCSQSGGGGRGSSRSSTCYKCGQEGHQARDCSQSGGVGRGSSRSGTCYKCGQEGHQARDCSQQASAGRREGGRACNKCGSEDHLARDCYSQSSGTGFGGRGGSNSSDWRKETVSSDENQCRDVITIHNEQIGRLIGRGGSKIKELMEDSNCKIKVANCEGEFGEVEVTLSGSKEDIIKAKRLIFKGGVSFSGGNKEYEEKKEEVKEFVKIDWNSFRANMAKTEEERFKDLPPIEKEFYIEADHIKNMHPEDVRQFRLENNNIMVDNPDCREVNIPNPVIKFEDAFEHYPLILEQIYKQGFTRPSPVQCQSWPILLSGYDLIGIAQTGTGKTLAFLLPAMIHIDSQPIPRSERTGPTCLVLCPTRELALQIQEEVNKINYKGIKSVCVYGGGNRREQVQVVKKGVEIVVATPGRLNDLIMSEIICVKSVTYLVLDEADRMLDMGFEPDIRKVLLDIRPDRQTVMTSATWPPDVQRLANQYLRRPLHVHVGTLDLAAVHSVKQEVIFMEDDRKKDYLFDFIHDMGPDDKLIVFVGKKVKADDISSDLALRNIMCQCIHGDREQCDREQALEEFKSGFVRILVATDVASRGLDVKDITHVLNYDFPRNIEEYVHRIGRTGRAGRTGTAITLLTRGDWRSAQQLIDIMSEAHQEVPQELIDMAERFKARQERDEREGRPSGGRRGGRGGGGFRGSGRQDDRNFYEKLMGGGKRRGYKDPLDAFVD